MKLIQKCILIFAFVRFLMGMILQTSFCKQIVRKAFHDNQIKLFTSNNTAMVNSFNTSMPYIGWTHI